MRIAEPIKELMIAEVIATAMKKLNSDINPADIFLTINNPIPKDSDTPLGYDYVRIALMGHTASQYAGELQCALKTLTHKAVTKSWTGDAVLYHASMEDLLKLTPEMIYAELIKRPPAPIPYRGI